MKKCIGLAVLIQSIINVQAIQISEIMYDPAGSDSGHEWIEVYNDTSTAIDIKSLKFFENSANHGISVVSGNDFLNAGEYAIIADNAGFFSLDYSTFTGGLFDSVFSLSNSGETLEMRTSSGESLHKVTYVPVPESSGTGNTLSLINGQYVKSQATPGAANIEFTGTVSTSTGGTTSTSTNTSSSVSNTGGYYVPTSKRTYMLGDINMLTNKDMHTTVGAETYFEIRNADSKNQNITGTVYWSYGDGAGGVGATTTHVYQNSGAFLAFVEVENSSVYGIDRLSVHVRDPRLDIHATSSGVVIRNHDEEDIDIGGFRVVCDTGIFKIARHMLLPKNSEAIISNTNMGFNCKNPKLSFSNNNLVPDYFETTKYENKNQLTTFDLSSTTRLASAKKVIYTKAKTKTSSGTVLGTSSISTKTPTVISKSNGEKGVVTGVKKWLYWLYE
jgi:hypothetical protein